MFYFALIIIASVYNAILSGRIIFQFAKSKEIIHRKLTIAGFLK